MQDPRPQNPAAYAWNDLDQQPLDDRQNTAASPEASRKRLSLDTLNRGPGAIASMSPATITADRHLPIAKEDLPVQIQPWPSELTKANKISANKFGRTETHAKPYTPDAGNDSSSKAIAYAAWGLDLERRRKRRKKPRFSRDA